MEGMRTFFLREDAPMPLEEGCVPAGECMGKGVSGGGVCRRGW